MSVEFGECHDCAQPLNAAAEVERLRGHVAGLLQAAEEMYDEYPWGHSFPHPVAQYAEEHGLDG